MKISMRNIACASRFLNAAVRTPRRKFLQHVAIALAALSFGLSCANVSAQSWPDKPIRMIVPFTPGGISDVLGRFWAQKLSAALGTSIVVENRPGAGTTIAAALIAKSPPDGYTLYFADVTTQAINATLYKSLPYSTEKDFTEIALVAAAPLVLVVPANFPVDTLPEFIALAKSKPGEFNYASSGNGTILHLTAETLKNMSGINLVHVPYKGSSDAVLATLSGQTSATFTTIPPALSQLKAGKLKALGVTSSESNAALPNVPPISKTIPGFNVVLYSGILGPAGMPPKIVERINAEVAKAMKDADTEKLYASLGADPVAMSPAEFTKQFRALSAAMGKAVKQAGAAVD